MNKQELIGKTADVISGPHEGRSGTIQQFRDLSIPGVNGGEPETYAVVEYMEKNCFNEWQTDQISVPIRRLSLR